MPLDNNFLGGILANESPLKPEGQKLFDYFSKIQIEKKKIPDPQDDLKSFVDQEKGFRSKENIELDIAKLENARKKALKDHTQRGDLFEWIFEKFGKQLLGLDPVRFEIDKTGEYDDRINSIDFLLRGTGTNGEKFRIGIDLTVSDSFNNIRKKTLKTQDKIKTDGELGEIKYYCSKKNNNKLRFRFVPRTVLALTSEQFDNLAKDIWDTIEKNETNIMTNNNNLKEPLVKQIIGELESNEGWIKEYIYEIGQNDTNNEGNYVKMLRSVQTALANMKKIQEEKTPQQ